jgi:broad specificity phosphatase PhoE
VEGRIQGRSDPGLSPKGQQQSVALLEQLKNRSLTTIYTSSLQRSILTAQPVANHFGLPIRKSSELDEIAFGILEGRNLYQFDEVTKKEWERFKDDRFNYRIPGAENYTDVAKRVRPFVERILEDHQGQEVLVIGHRVVNRLLIGMFLEFPLEWVLKIEQTHDCLYLIQKNDETKVFHYINGKIGEGVVAVGEEVIL